MSAVDHRRSPSVQQNASHNHRDDRHDRHYSESYRRQHDEEDRYYRYESRRSSDQYYRRSRESSREYSGRSREYTRSPRGSREYTRSPRGSRSPRESTGRHRRSHSRQRTQSPATVQGTRAREASLPLQHLIKQVSGVSEQRSLPYRPPLWDELDTAQRQLVQEARAYVREQQPQILAKKNTLKSHIGAGAAQAPLMSPVLPPSPDSMQHSISLQHYILLASRVYVGSIPVEVDEAMLRPVFTPYGAVRHVTLNIDPNTGKHKGFAFVEYEVPEAALLALRHGSGRLCGGRQLTVNKTNTFPMEMPAGAPKAPPERLYVSNVHSAMTVDDLHAMFESFGALLGCVLITESMTLRHKGYGYVEYVEAKSAQAALNALQGFEVGGQGLCLTHCVLGIDIPGIPPRVKKETIVAKTIFDPIKESRVLVMDNMVSPDEVDDELATDVKEECTRFGPVDRVLVHLGRNKQEESVVRLFVVFQTVQARRDAQKIMHHRWFGGRSVRANAYDQSKWDAGVFENEPIS